MKRHTTLVDLMLAPPFSIASCPALGAWHRLGVYCSRLTNGGCIASCRAWSDDTWLRTVGCRLSETQQAIAEGLAAWHGEDLLVEGYDLENETKYLAKAGSASKARDALAKRRTAPDSTAPDLTSPHSTSPHSTLHDISSDIRPEIREERRTDGGLAKLERLQKVLAEYGINIPIAEAESWRASLEKMHPTGWKVDRVLDTIAGSATIDEARGRLIAASRAIETDQGDPKPQPVPRLPRGAVPLVGESQLVAQEAEETDHVIAFHSPERIRAFLEAKAQGEATGGLRRSNAIESAAETSEAQSSPDACESADAAS